MLLAPQTQSADRVRSASEGTRHGRTSRPATPASALSLHPGSSAERWRLPSQSLRGHGQGIRPKGARERTSRSSGFAVLWTLLRRLVQYRLPPFPAGLSLTSGVQPFPTRRVSGLTGPTPVSQFLPTSPLMIGKCRLLY